MTFNLERDTQPGRINAKVWETLLDGAALCEKFKSEYIRFRPPMMTVFSNVMPLMASLSLDRWKIWRITRNFDLVRVDAKKLAAKQSQIPMKIPNNKFGFSS